MQAAAREREPEYVRNVAGEDEVALAVGIALNPKGGGVGQRTNNKRCYDVRRAFAERIERTIGIGEAKLMVSLRRVACKHRRGFPPTV